MKAKNATPGTRVRHKITGAVGTVVSDDDFLCDVVAVHYDDLPSTMMARPAHLRLADKTVRPMVIAYQPPQRGTEQQPDATGPTDGEAHAAKPAQDEVALRLLPRFDPEMLCVFRNVGRVPVWVYDAAGDKVIAVGPRSTLEVPRSWASVAGGETVRGFGGADEPDPADRMRAIADAAWTEGYDVGREGKPPHNPYRAHVDG